MTNGEDDWWMKNLYSEVGGKQKGYSSRKLSQLPTPAQSRHRLNHIHSTVSSPSRFGIAMHSHVSLVVAANFLDADVIFGVNEWLGGGIGFCHGYYAGHVPEVVLVLNFDLDYQNPVKKRQEQKEHEYFVSRSHLCI